jgi:SAM-dependent methyltransferase
MLALDISPVGLTKARKLADSRHLAIETLCCDLADYEPPQATFDLVVAIWMHLPPPLRAETHRRLVAALRPGGHLILEAYTPCQLRFGTGGPPSVALLIEPEVLRQELSGLALLVLQEHERWIEEGP